MNTKQPQRGVEKRSENTHLRRQKMIRDACELIADLGPIQFTLSSLAAKSEVTLPTINNQLGKKADVFQVIVDCMIQKTQSTLFDFDLSSPLRALEQLTESLISLYRGDEALYKAAFFIGETEDLFEHEIPDVLYEKSINTAIGIVKSARENGELLGNIDQTLLAHMLFENQRFVRRDWMRGYISLEVYKHKLLSAAYVTLAADASKEMHTILLNKIDELTL